MAEIAKKDEFQIKHYMPTSFYVHHADVFRQYSAFICHEVWLLKAGVCKKLYDFNPNRLLEIGLYFCFILSGFLLFLQA